MFTLTLLIITTVNIFICITNTGYHNNIMLIILGII